MVEISQEDVDTIAKRLRRAQGQLGGVVCMIEEVATARRS